MAKKKSKKLAQVPVTNSTELYMHINFIQSKLYITIMKTLQIQVYYTGNACDQKVAEFTNTLCMYIRYGTIHYK